MEDDTTSKSIKKKKISKLVPSGEELEPINEEASLSSIVSEDPSVLSVGAAKPLTPGPSLLGDSVDDLENKLDDEINGLPTLSPSQRGRRTLKIGIVENDEQAEGKNRNPEAGKVHLWGVKNAIDKEACKASKTTNDQAVEETSTAEMSDEDDSSTDSNEEVTRKNERDCDDRESSEVNNEKSNDEAPWYLDKKWGRNKSNSEETHNSVYESKQAREDIKKRLWEKRIACSPQGNEKDGNNKVEEEKPIRPKQYRPSDSHFGGCSIRDHRPPNLPGNDGVVMNLTDSVLHGLEEDKVKGPEKMYDYDDDHTTATDELLRSEEQGLTWRLDPKESLSDWTIKVVNKETNEVESYHVHKNILAVGPYKSEYFSQLFTNNDSDSKQNASSSSNSFRSNFKGVASKADTMSNVTVATMPGVATKAIPIFLDFVYSREHALKISTRSATSLRYISKYFGVRMLHKRVMKFIRSDIILPNIEVYYKDCETLHDEKVSAMVALQCSKQIMKITPSNPLLKIFKPAFFAKILTTEEQKVNDPIERSTHISLLLAEFCGLNNNLIDEEQFLKLSNEKHMPIVDYDAALSLLEVEANSVESVATAKLDSGMTSLQKRCVLALSQNWQKLSEVEKQKLIGVCSKIPSGVVGELLYMALLDFRQKTNDDNRNDITKGNSLKSEPDRGPIIKKEYEGKIADMKTKFQGVRKGYEEKIMNMKQEFQGANSKLKREYEKNIVRLRNLCLEKDKRIGSLVGSINQIQRLPNSPDGKLVPSSNKNRATHMPAGAFPQSKDGFLYMSKIKGKKLPVYFFNPDDA